MQKKTRRPAITGIISAQLQIFWSTFANSWKRDYCFESSFQRFNRNINSTTDFYILCKRGDITNFVQNFLSHCTEKLRRRTFLCFKKFLVSKNFMHRRRVSWSSRKFFVSQDRKTSYGVPSVFQKLSSTEKNLWIRDGGITFFSVENFLSQCAKKFRGEPFDFSENFGNLKILCIRRRYHYFLFKFFCLTVAKNFIRELFCVSEKFWYIKIYMDRRGVGYHVFPSKFFLSPSSEKFRRGTHLGFRKFINKFLASKLINKVKKCR